MAECMTGDLTLLIRDGTVPCWWDAEIHKVTLDLLQGLFTACEEVAGSQEILMKNALLTLDKNLVLPAKMFNLKKKLINMLKKHKLTSAADFLYDSNKLRFVGEQCKNHGITQTLLDDILVNSDVISPPIVTITNHIIIELYNYYKKKAYTTIELKMWIEFFMKQTVEDTIIKKVIDLFGQKKILIKKKKEVELLDFLARDFMLPEKRLPKELSENDIPLSQKVAVEAQLGKHHVEISKVIDELSNANENVEELTRIIMCNEKDQAVTEEKLKSLENEIRFFKIEQELKANKLLSLIEQLAPLSKKNVKRAIQRRETKIKILADNMNSMRTDFELTLKETRDKLDDISVEFQLKCKEMDQINKTLDNTIKSKTKSQKLKWYYKSVCEASVKHDHDITNSVLEIEELKEKLNYAENKNCELEEELRALREGKIYTKESGRYSNDVRAVYQDLICLGVGTNNVEKVVLTVLTKIAKMSVDFLPKPTFAKTMYSETRRLSQIHVAETLKNNYENSNRTLHTDGTSKHGKHYGVYNIVGNDSKVTVCGMSEMACGDTETQLDVMKGILQEIEDSVQGSDANVANKIVVSVKNLMSDRHIVQKKFNKLFQEYRAAILPQIIQGWDELDETARNDFERVNDFFCGMHFMVGMADQSEAALKAWEKLLFGESPVGTVANGGYSKGESGTQRLIRTVCKSVQTKGCEKSGRVSDFASYLLEAGFDSVPLVPFKGNRFNILFYNGGICFFLNEHLKNFFNDVHSENKLLKAVYHDLQVPAFITGCRALGLVNKFVTGPLWRLLESNLHVLEMNDLYQNMEKLFSEIAVDSSAFLKGEVFF